MPLRMTEKSLPALRWLGWRPLLLAGLAVFLLRPLLKTGYMYDDVTNSLLPGVLKVEGYTLPGCIWSVMKVSLYGGRFFPLVWVELFSLFHLVPDVVAYKAVVIAGVAGDVLLFYAFVRQVSKDQVFACFATCWLLPLFHFRGFPDPILAFSLLLQIVTAGVLTSLLALQIYLDTNRRRWLALSAASYAVVMMTYEITYTLFLIGCRLFGCSPRKSANS
jgi:hypothetical protein